MPTVPYNPVPQEVASGSLSDQNVRVSEETFGGDIARAISGLGRTVEGVGDQIYERAKWLQNLNNQAEARRADADFIIQSGRLTAEFNSLEGDNAVKAYPKYQQNLKALRESIRGGLTTRGAQDMYDGQTLGTLSRAIFSGAQSTARAQKQFVVQSMEAQREAITQEASQYPQDDMVTTRAVRRIEASVDQEGRLRGMPPEAISNAKLAATSKLYANQVEQIAKEFPLQGPEKLAALKPKMTVADFKRAENVVNNQRDAYGTAKIATDLVSTHLDSEGNLNISVEELQAKARTLAEQFSPDDPGFQTKTVRALQAELNQRKYSARQEKYDNRDVINSAILTGHINNLDDLLANPQASAAYYRLPPSEQLKVPARIDNYIKARDRDYNERSLTTIMGLKNNDVEAFLNLEPTDERYRLTQAQIRQVQTEQAKIKKQTSGDPRVSRAMGWMRAGFGSQMQALDVYSRTNRNKEDYDHLTGAVQQSLDLWQEEHKKPPTYKEFNEQIAPQILKISREPGMFGVYGYGLFGTDRPFFRHDTSTREYRSFYDNAKDEIKRRGGSEPTDEEIYKAYTRMQLLKLYPAKGSNVGP